MNWMILLLSCGWVWGFAQAAVITQAQDPATKQAEDMVAGVNQGGVGKIRLNLKTGRLEVRDEAGIMIDELAAGNAGRAVDVYGQEIRLSFGKDDMGRKSVLVRPGPAMRKPISVEVFGRQAVLSPEASLLATLGEDQQIYFEPSICGQVYYIENVGREGSQVSRLASSKREVAVLAKPSNLNGTGPGLASDAQEDSKSIEKAGDAVKSVFCAVFGLPDKQPTTKAKVYRLRGKGETQDPMSGARSSASSSGSSLILSPAPQN